jgi:hypothetical protein
MKSKIILKLKKLMRHERSARAVGNTAEADAFAGTILFLREKHQIFEEIPLDDFQDADWGAELIFDAKSPLFRTERVLWEEGLCLITAAFFGCGFDFQVFTNLKRVIGKKEDRKRVKRTFLFLHSVATDKAKDLLEGLPEETRAADIRMIEESFLLGFIEGLFERLSVVKQAEQEIQEFRIQRGETENAQALVKSERIIIPEKRPSQKSKAPEIQFSENQTEVISEINLDEPAFILGKQFAFSTALSDDLELPVQKVKDEVEEINALIRSEREEMRRRAMGEFYYGFDRSVSSPSSTVYVQVSFDFGE